MSKKQQEKDEMKECTDYVAWRVLCHCIQDADSKEDALQRLASAVSELQSNGVSLIEKNWTPHYEDDLAKHYNIPDDDEWKVVDDDI